MMFEQIINSVSQKNKKCIYADTVPIQNGHWVTLSHNRISACHNRQRKRVNQHCNQSISKFTPAIDKTLQNMVKSF